MTHSKIQRLLLLIPLLTFTGLASGSTANFESGTISDFVSVNGVNEQCIALAAMPKTHYSKHDIKTQSKYCSIDFRKVALCPKLWSTSPGTIIYEIDVAKYAGDYTRFEHQHCAEGHHARQAAVDKLATYKLSVNDRNTSATYAPSSWIYFHLSRYFSTGVLVPVAVYRSLDKQVHLERVVEPALDIVANRHGLRMLSAGWQFLESVETGKQSASAGNAVLSGGDTLVFGVLLDNKGDRYGVEINGTRESGWGVGQNYDFQQTAPFIALRSGLPIGQAVTDGIHKARSNPQMAKSLSNDILPAQVVLWMNDILEITLLDYILGQQDRVGNVDYHWRWLWLNDGKVHSKSAHGKNPPANLVEFQPLRLRQSAINDNDAGVRRGYTNYAVKTGMLEGLRHYNPHLFKKLAELAADFESRGEIYQWFVDSSGLGQSEINSIAKRIASAYSLLQSDRDACRLTLDLIPEDYMFDSTTLKYQSAQPCEVFSN